MSKIPRPSWLPLAKEMELRRLRDTSKLQAVKDLKDFSKEHVTWTNSAGETYTGWGLKECKEYIEQLDALGPDPFVELSIRIDEIRRMREELPSLLRDAIPEISEETIARAMADEDFLKSIAQTGVTANTFGI